MAQTRVTIKEDAPPAFVEDLAWDDGWALEDLTPRGEGPVAVDRQGNRQQSYLCIDEQEPAELLFALSSHYPPFLWIPLGQDLAPLPRVVATYFRAAVPREADLDQHARLLLGTTGML